VTVEAIYDLHCCIPSCRQFTLYYYAKLLRSQQLNAQKMEMQPSDCSQLGRVWHQASGICMMSRKRLPAGVQE